VPQGTETTYVPTYISRETRDRILYNGESRRTDRRTDGRTPYWISSTEALSFCGNAFSWAQWFLARSSRGFFYIIELGFVDGLLDGILLGLVDDFLTGLAEGFFDGILDGFFNGILLGLVDDFLLSLAESFFDDILDGFFNGIMLDLVDGFFARLIGGKNS
jgi:hypothetical protein